MFMVLVNDTDFRTDIYVYTAWKVSKYWVFSGLYFPVFRLNTKISGANLHFQSKFRKIRTRKNSVFGHLSHNIMVSIVSFKIYLHNIMFWVYSVKSYFHLSLWKNQQLLGSKCYNWLITQPNETEFTILIIMFWNFTIF